MFHIFINSCAIVTTFVHWNSTVFAGDEDYFDAMEDHARSTTSVSSRGSMDGLHSPSGNGRHRSTDADGASQSDGSEVDHGDGVLDKLSAWWSRHLGDSPGSTAPSPRHPSPPAVAIPPNSTILAPEDTTQQGCIGLFTATQAVVASKRFVRLAKPRAGSSCKRLPDVGASAGGQGQGFAWKPADPASFMVRSRDYMRTRIKEPSEGSIYQLIGMDMYSFDFKLYHIAQHVELPPVPRLGPGAEVLPKDQRLPPLLIMNLQLPLYAPTMFGGTNDGNGHSLVYYFALPEGWEPSQVANKAALGLVQRFVNNGVEADGTPTRDRLKLLPSIVNLDEWAEKGPLSGTEVRLIRNYNGKPLLTRPQQRFYTHPQGTYLEVDLDVHSYAYLARRAFHGYMTRLAPVIFENAFVVQGNRPEELPEVVLGGARVYRVDFTQVRPFPAKSLEELGQEQRPDGAPESQGKVALTT